MVSLRHVDQDVLARRAEAAAAKKAAKEAAKEAAKAAKEAAKEVSQPPAKDGASAPTPPRKQAAGKGNSVSLASLRDKLHRGRSRSGNKDGRNGSKVVKGGKFHDDFMDTDDDSTVVPEVQKETDDDETVLPEENGQQEKGTDDDETVLPEENGQEENTTAQEDDSKDDSNYVPDDDEDLEQDREDEKEFDRIFDEIVEELEDENSDLEVELLKNLEGTVDEASRATNESSDGSAKDNAKEGGVLEATEKPEASAKNNATEATEAEEKDGVEYSYGADVKFAETDSEKALFAALDAAEAKIDPALKAEDFPTAMAAMAELRGPVDAFFEDVQVNTDNDILRRNRLNLLSQIRKVCSSVADLTRIEG